ncbi:MAG: hypothetical protein ABI718_03825 [Acidobacteriota bacterium]
MRSFLNIASALICALLACSITQCASRGSKVTKERNLAFDFDRNELVLSKASIAGTPGRFLIATALPRSLVDDHFRDIGTGSPTLRLGNHFRTTVNPARFDLENLADGFVGFDVWRRWTIAVDYRNRLITLLTGDTDRSDLTRYEFSGVPTVPVQVGDEVYQAVIDTALPDTLLLPLNLNPSGLPGRARVNITLAGHTFSNVDVAYGPTSSVRVGNRLLSSFLLFINYPGHWVGFWYDRRPHRLTPGVVSGASPANSSADPTINDPAGE